MTHARNGTRHLRQGAYRCAAAITSYLSYYALHTNPPQITSTLHQQLKLLLIMACGHDCVVIVRAIAMAQQQHLDV
jgi:hypothetical protein